MGSPPSTSATRPPFSWTAVTSATQDALVLHSKSSGARRPMEERRWGTGGGTGEAQSASDHVQPYTSLFGRRPLHLRSANKWGRAGGRRTRPVLMSISTLGLGRTNVAPNGC